MFSGFVGSQFLGFLSLLPQNHINLCPGRRDTQISYLDPILSDGVDGRSQDYKRCGSVIRFTIESRHYRSATFCVRVLSGYFDLDYVV